MLKSQLSESKPIDKLKAGCGAACLKTAGPITGTALGMGYGNDLNLMQQLAIDNEKRISVEYNALGTVKVRRI